jgi:hypothetical protein
MLHSHQSLSVLHHSSALTLSCLPESDLSAFSLDQSTALPTPRKLRTSFGRTTFLNQSVFTTFPQLQIFNFLDGAIRSYISVHLIADQHITLSYALAIDLAAAETSSNARFIFKEIHMILSKYLHI